MAGTSSDVRLPDIEVLRQIAREELSKKLQSVSARTNPYSFQGIYFVKDSETAPRLCEFSKQTGFYSALRW